MRKKKAKIRNKNFFLANTGKQPLKEHSIAAALYGYKLLQSLKFKPRIEKKISKYLIYSALLHDTGKVSDSFQKYIKEKAGIDNAEDMPRDAECSRPKTFKGPFHNEISWAYAGNFFEFDNRETRETVRHSIYWHHPANLKDKEDTLRFENSQTIFKSEEENTTDLLKKIHEFVDDLRDSFFSDYGRDFNWQNNPLEKPCEDTIEAIQCPKFFSHEPCETKNNGYKQLCLNLLLESDRTVSSWKPKELDDFLKNWKDEKLCLNQRDKSPVLENVGSSKKSKEQCDLANKMASKKLSVCGVDPAGGKTSVALYWWSFSNNEYPFMIALPKQQQVVGLVDSLQEDCKRIYGDKKLKMEAVFNGKRQFISWDPPEDNSDLLISDINILVFDRFLSPYYKRSQSSEFLTMLRSHLVLDEFHEFRDLPKMIPSLKEVLTIRSWLDSGVKTLMLSGTPEPSLLKLLHIEDITDKSKVFKRTELSPRGNHKFKMFAEEENLEEVHKFLSDCLYSFLRVADCQKAFSHFLKIYKDTIKMIHSYFTADDKKDLLKDILKEHGKDAVPSASEKSVITSKMLQSSYNVSFDKAIVELSQPYMDCQTAGRINRFENKPDAEMRFFYNENSEKFFNENKAGFKEIHKEWKEHIVSFMDEQKGQAVSIRKLMESYDNFWNENNVNKSLKILKERHKEAIEELNEYTPKRLSPGKKKKTSSSRLNSLFRGESRYLSACVVDDNGNAIDQLHDENLLSEGRRYVIDKIKKAMEVCLKTNKQCDRANKIKDQEEFEYNKYAHAFGFKTERPLLSSHVDLDIDKCLKEHLSDEDSKQTEHHVYNKKFGLVKKSLLENG